MRRLGVGQPPIFQEPGVERLGSPLAVVRSDSWRPTATSEYDSTSRIPDPDSIEKINRDELIRKERRRSNCRRDYIYQSEATCCERSRFTATKLSRFNGYNIHNRQIDVLASNMVG